MSQVHPVIDEATWQRIYERIRRLSPRRQEEIADYLDFILEREGDQSWELSAEDRASMARHDAGDFSDTVSLAEVEDRILRGDIDGP